MTPTPRGSSLNGSARFSRSEPITLRWLLAVANLSEQHQALMAVAAALVTYSSADGTGAWPSLPDLAKRARIGRTSAYEVTQLLKGHGLLTWDVLSVKDHVTPGTGRGFGNHYRLHLPRSVRSANPSSSGSVRQMAQKGSPRELELHHELEGGAANAARLPGELEDGANPCPGCGKVGGLLVGDKTARCVRPECGWRWAG